MSKTLNEAMGTAEDEIVSARGGTAYAASSARVSFPETTASESLRLAILRTLEELRREAAERREKAADETEEAEPTVDEELGGVVESVRGDRLPTSRYSAASTR